MQKPSLGRIVLFVEKGAAPSPAIITNVWSDVCVNLTVFRDAMQTAAKTSVEYAEPGQEASSWASWHWPLRV